MATMVQASGHPSSAASFIGRLPVPASSFIGRDEELAELSLALAEARVVTLTGPSGIGKTRIAMAVAGRLASRYPDGVWLVDLAPVSESGLLPRAVTAALGLPYEPGRDPADTLFAYLRHRRALVVLDNCERMLEATSALSGSLVGKATEVSVLTTSHRPLAVAGERVVAVGPMSLPTPHAGDAGDGLACDSVALFCARAGAARAGSFNLSDDVAPAVVEICRRLDGMPLAIELAAARTAVLTPAEIAERLEDRFRLLSRGGPLSLPRHATLRAALDWSHDLLSTSEAALLRRLSVFSGGAALAAAEKVCTGGELAAEQVLDVMADLVSRSLVIADTSGPRARFHLLETVRHYSDERLADAGETEAYKTRHAEWCLALAEVSWHPLDQGDRGVGLELEAELDNLRAAQEWTADGQAPELGLRLAAAMTPFWHTRGYFREGQTKLERALHSPPEGLEALRSRALWSLGVLAVLQGDVVTATPAVEESLALARSGGLKRAEAQALNLLGFISLFTQDPVSAMPMLEESVVLARKTANISCLVNALSSYARCHLFLGDAHAAQAIFEECLELSNHQNGSDLIGLGWAATISGEQRRAGELFRQALPLVRDDGAPFEMALVLSFLGELAWVDGDAEQARAFLQEGQELARSMGAPFPLVRCLCGLARMALAAGDVEGARALVEESSTVADDSRLPYALVRCLHVEGLVHLAQGDAKEAMASFEAALRAARRNCDAIGISQSLHQLGRLARHLGNDERASALHAKALAFQARVPDAGGIACTLEALAGLGVDQGRHRLAARLFGAADALRERSGSSRPPEEGEAHRVDVAALAAGLAPDVLEGLWAEGATLGWADAVALATKGMGPRDRPDRGWAALTPSERQVVEMAAEGLTSNEIGEKLFISGRTVQGHLRRAFPKLGVTSRRQLRDIVQTATSEDAWH